MLNGVNSAVTARLRTGGPDEKEQPMAVSLRTSVDRVSNPKHLEEAVDEVFRLMLGSDCRRVEDGTAIEPELATAVVGFGGVLSGACVFACGREAAIKIATLMTGMEFDEIDDTVKDGIGEICNMLAGAWKGKVPELAANCGLSVPAVITGRDYKLHVQAPEFHLHHVYSLADVYFSVTIVCDGLK